MKVPILGFEFPRNARAELANGAELCVKLHEFKGLAPMLVVARRFLYGSGVRLRFIRWKASAVSGD